MRVEYKSIGSAGFRGDRQIPQTADMHHQQIKKRPANRDQTNHQIAAQ
jgi:hypothetical protein